MVGFNLRLGPGDPALEKAGKDHNSNQEGSTYNEDNVPGPETVIKKAYSFAIKINY